MSSETEAKTGQDSPTGSTTPTQSESQATATISSGSLRYDSSPAALESTLETWLSNIVVVGQHKKRATAEDYHGHYYSHVVTPTTWLGDKTRSDIVGKLGSDFFTVGLKFNGGILYTEGRNECSTTVVTADLSLADKLPYEVFEEGLKRLLVDQSKIDMLVNSKLAKKCGIRQGKPVSVSNKKLLNLIPEMQYVHDVCGSYFVPKDHYALLLSLPVEHRRFLMLCFDRAKEQGVQPFNVSLEVSEKDVDGDILLVDGYALTKHEASSLAERGILSAQTMLDVASDVGVTDIAPYMKTMQKLAKRLKQ